MKNAEIRKKREKPILENPLFMGKTGILQFCIYGEREHILKNINNY